VLIAQVVFLLEHRQTNTPTHTHTVTNATDYSTHALATGGVGKALKHNYIN